LCRDDALEKTGPLLSTGGREHNALFISKSRRGILKKRGTSHLIAKRQTTGI